jgi:effector-binding domain-containing protein
LKLAGTLGEFTDVKTLPAMELVIAVKPEGLADPTSIYEKLFPWIHQQGYMVADAHSEVFLTGSMSGDYARMRTEILVPVQKASKTRD